jgi:anti-sigma28 factor (negative regulator of flagellin synthesis)
MTKVPSKGRKDLSTLITNDNELGRAGGNPKTKISGKVESVKINLRKAAQERQKLAVLLSRKGREFVADKIRQLKGTIAKGNYEVDPREVAKRMLRAEISWHLEKIKVPLMSLDLTELLALRRKRNGEGKNDDGSWEIDKTPPSSSFTNKSIHNRT